MAPGAEWNRQDYKEYKCTQKAQRNCERNKSVTRPKLCNEKRISNSSQRDKNTEKQQSSMALSNNMANYFHIYEPGPPGRLWKTMQNAAAANKTHRLPRDSFWRSLVSLWAFTGFSRGFLFLATAGRHQMKGTRDVAHPGRIFYACSPKDEGASECKSKGKIVGQP